MANPGIVLKLVALVFLCMLANWPQHGEAVIPCDTVVSDMAPCLLYILQGQGESPLCCANLVSLINSANSQTTADRQSVCYCLETLGSTFSDAEIVNAATLPQHCGTYIPYTISRNMDCSSVS